MKPREEICLVFYEAGGPRAILYSNGHNTFYRLKKMTREEIGNLLGTESKIDVPIKPKTIPVKSEI